MSENDLTPAGRPNLVAEPAPWRGTMPGYGGTMFGQDRVAIQLPQPPTAEEWRKADDLRKLALAPSADRSRLAKEQEQLAAADKAVEAATGSAERARTALIEARVEDRDHRKAEEHLQTAETVLGSAKRAAAIQRDVVETLRGRLIERVRQDLAATARAKLGDAHATYDAALGGLAKAPAFIDELRRARQAEIAAAGELASALGETPRRGFSGQYDDVPNGRRYVSISEEVDKLAIVIDQLPDPIRLEGGAVAAHLARRSDAAAEDRPVLRPIDEVDSRR